MVRWKWAAGIVVVAVVAAGVAAAIRLNSLADEIADARSRIADLEDNLRYANETRFEGLADADERYRDLRNKMRSRLTKLQREARRNANRLDNVLCFNDSSPVSDGFFRHPISGDVDGDGLDDVVRTLARPTRNGGCKYLLTVQTDTGFFAKRVRVEDSFALENSFVPWMLVDFNGVPGYEIVVHIGSGAYAQIGQIFTLSEGRLASIRGFGSRDIWIGGASAGNGSAMGCLDPNGDTIFRDTWGYAGDGTHHELTRRFYRVVGTQATLYFRERRVVDLMKALNRFPEFEEQDESDYTFGRCSVVMDDR
jgi:hypothetical protein